MARIPKVKQMTYEELANKFDITPNKAHIEVKKTYNKIINNLVTNHSIPVWDAVMGVKEFFGMSEKEAVDKLNKDYRERLEKEALEKYHVSGVSKHDKSN